MTVLLVDSGPLLALADPGHAAHATCTAFLKTYRGRLLTTWAVLNEFSRRAPAEDSALPLYRWIERGGLELMSLGKDELVSAIDWIERYAEGPMALADASLVVAALKTGSTAVWTLERDTFRSYRLPGRKHFSLV